MQVLQARGLFPYLYYCKMVNNKMIGKCLNPALCYRKYLKWSDNQRKFRDRNQRSYDSLLNRIKEEGIESNIDYSRHALIRMKERLILKEDIESILDMAWVVEGRSNGELLVLAYYKRNYRMIPLHISLMPDGGFYYLIKTVYNPHKKIWGDTYENKICFCGKKRFGEAI